MKHRRNLKLITVYGSKVLDDDEARALRLAKSASISARPRHQTRLAQAPERRSMHRAMLAVEARIVDACWTLARLPMGKGNGWPPRNGIDYVHDDLDMWAAGIHWAAPRPKPAPPPAKSIDAMVEPLGWLQLCDRRDARVLAMGATSKRGDVFRYVNWGEVRERLPELKGYSRRSLQKFYTDGLRCIVIELSIKAVKN